MNQYFVTIFTGSISIVAALISYFNYRLNKTLYIKNLLFNEKLKKYIELSRKIAEFIELLDVIGPTVNAFNSKTVDANVLAELHKKATAIGLSIEYMIIESHMLVPENILKVMIDFAEYQNLGLPYCLTKVESAVYWEKDQIIRRKAEMLINAFREDLSVDRLSLKLASVKSSKEKS